MASAPRPSSSLYIRLLREARPYWAHIFGLFLLELMGTPLALLAPLPLMLVVDSVINGEPLPARLEPWLPESLGAGGGLLLFLTVFLVLIALLSRLQGMSVNIGRTWVGQKLVLGLQTRLFGHLQRLSLAYHDREGSYDATYRVQYDTGSIRSVAIDGLIPFVTSAFQLVAMVWVTALIDRKLALVAVAISPVLILLTHFYRPPLRRRWKNVKRLESSAMSVVQESLAAMRVVKAFGQEDRESGRYAERASASLQAQMDVIIFESGYSLLVGLTVAIGTASVLFLGAGQVQAGTMTLGNLLLVMGYLGQIYGPLKTIGKKVAGLQRALASAERVYAVLDAEPEVVERKHARSIESAQGHVTFEDVAFGYRPETPVLEGVSVDVPAGSRVGISGRTGSGKTTFLSLLPRFYDPIGGRILLDGVDLRDLKIADLRKQFSIVLQEPLLFSTSIEENIAFGYPDASHEQIVAAARAANAHDFIVNLEGGYSTDVGERGLRLSGGERQRIAIARAFLKDAPILILDEPTSSVDIKTESGIFEALERLMEGRTTFVIAHRVNTIQGCDIQLRIADGRARVVTEAEVSRLATEGDRA